MKLEDIDKIFNNNQHQFDKMPSDKLWERLEEKLDTTPSMWEEKPTTKVRWLRYIAAAAVVLIMMVPAMYLIDGTGVTPQAHENTSIEYPAVAKAENNESESIRSLKDTPSAKIAKEEKTIAKPIQEPQISTNAKREAALRQYVSEDIEEKTFDNTDATAFHTKPKERVKNLTRPTIKAAPKPSITRQPLSPPSPTSSNSSSAKDIVADQELEEDFSFAEVEIEEEIELEEVEISAYQVPRKAMPVNKNATGNVQSGNWNGDITNDIYADARYNVDFDRSQFSNALAPTNAYTFESQTQKQEAKQTTKNRKKESKKLQSKRSVSNKADATLALPTLGFLNNLEGDWAQYIGEKSYYETWANSPNGTLFGTASTLQNGGVLFKEDISITPLQNGDLLYTIHHPQTQQTLTLQASTINVDNENLLIFENLQNEFLRRITYRLATNTMLEITFEGKKENQIIVKQLIMVKQK